MTNKLPTLIAEIKGFSSDDYHTDEALDKSLEFIEAALPHLQRLLTLEAKVEAKQASIDELMLEYCPDEMTEGQIKNWEKHQVKSSS